MTAHDGQAASPQLPPSRTEPDGSAVVRLLSYNVRSLRDDREALVRVIRACAPDVVCVQEAPRFFRWRKYAAWLARRTELTPVTGGATAAGPMVLASLRAHVEHTEDVLLPRTPGLHRRGFATAVLRFGPAARLGVISFHLSLQAQERYAQGRALRQRLAGMGEFAVAAGDVNEQPTGRTFRMLRDEFHDVWEKAPWGAELTSTAAAPHQRIDAVFSTAGPELIAGGVPVGLPGVTERDLRAASDHRPVLTVLRVPARRG
ncbi:MULTISPECIES: endonuclease/exonuclease/phosphatase family protein [Streptomyces]|uniref:endonuclease/exonuclease/phosphatase family protein n=1 Tax=Streptomyces TaxID=1883 RepID=UPI0004BD18E5|nr:MULTISPECIES: endonuclease/exonuclease/phosphatase family protein [unclassified Streptomyces]